MKDQTKRDLIFFGATAGLILVLVPLILMFADTVKAP